MEKERQSAFPITIEDNGNTSVTYLGLTKREYFAAMAMQEYIATGKASNVIDWVRCADELLKALETLKSE